MFTYILMGLPFFVAVLLLDCIFLKTYVIKTKNFWVVLIIMLGMTAVFDQFLTGLPIVHYNEAHMVGLRIWHAPVEDFMYTIAAVIGMGSMIKYVEK